MSGFLITHLSLTGPNAPEARIDFGEAFNVIAGPSDTGKTFIAQCIDYGLGRRRTPKTIPEAQSYDTLHLGVRKRSEDLSYTITRSLKGGNATLSADGLEDRTLGAQHRPDSDDTISGFLLSLAELSGKVVRTNARGVTRGLSFRDLTLLAIVDEEAVISERSPITTGQYTTKTVETNVFRLLLTGVDDSSVVSPTDSPREAARKEGQEQLIETLLDRLQTRLNELGVESDASLLRGRLERLDESYATYERQLNEEHRAISDLEQERRAAWTELRTVESRIAVLNELQERFTLLEEQYGSDLRRLDAIAEAGELLGQLNEERCPVCGASFEHHDPTHQDEQASASDVTDACRAEAEKVRLLLSDLQSTSEDTLRELGSLSQRQVTLRGSVTNSNRQINEVLRPRSQETAAFLTESRSARDTCIKALELHARIDELNEMLESDVATESPTDNTFKTDIGSDEAYALCKTIQTLLTSWSFPGVESVVFSEADQDLMISGRKRASHGKGVRAIFRAAFNIGLLQYCVASSRPHPGFVLVDSPLVVYREPDADEDGFEAHVKDAFYRSLASSESKAQVIILENEEPPSDIDSTATVIHFTGTTQGRTGFIPAPDNES